MGDLHLWVNVHLYWNYGGRFWKKGSEKKEVLPFTTEVSHQQWHTTSVGGDFSRWRHSQRSQ